MPIFRFEAMDTSGTQFQDLVEAASPEEAAQKVKELGLFLTKLTEVAPATKGNKKTQHTIFPSGGVSFFLRVKSFWRSLRNSLKSREVSAPPPTAPLGNPATKRTEEKPLHQDTPSRPAAAARSRLLGEVLVDLGLIDEDQLWDLLDEARTTGEFTGQIAIARGLIAEEHLLMALGELHGLRVVDLEATKPQPEAIALVPETMATVYKVLPLALKDNILTVAIGDPNTLATLDDLRNFLGVTEVRVLLASPRAIEGMSSRVYREKEGSVLDLIRQLEQDETLRAQDTGKETSYDLASIMEIQDAAPVRKLLNMVMLLAIKDRASDIHFEPFEDEYKLRYRADGVLMELVPPPRHLAPEIADRIKTMANLDLAERRLPQHGRIELNVGGNPVNMRVSVLPTMFGEHIAIRVCDPTSVRLDLNGVGMDPALVTQFREIIHQPSGIVLMAGPPGSGKTTTLCSALNELNDITRKIVIAEDQVEYEIDGIVHCPMREFTAADGVRSILGQEPDLIAVSEIHDPETAQLAVELADTGRLVLSTLDAGDASSSILRLHGLGLEPLVLADTLKGVLAQHLVRRICEDCRTEFEPSKEMLMELNLRPHEVQGMKFYYGRGCDRCSNTGHRGRMGIFELLIVNDPVRDLISSGASTDQLRHACGELGMRTFRDSGLSAIFAGRTTIDEVVRETAPNNPA